MTTWPLDEEKDKSILLVIDEITELNDLHEFMNDEQLDKALVTVIKLLVQPNIPAARAPSLIIELQALSAKFAIMATTYATIKRDRAGTDNNFKKNIYMTMSDSIDRLVDAVKYTAKFGA